MYIICASMFHRSVSAPTAVYWEYLNSKNKRWIRSLCSVNMSTAFFLIPLIFECALCLKGTPLSYSEYLAKRVICILHIFTYSYLYRN